MGGKGNALMASPSLAAAANQTGGGERDGGETLSFDTILSIFRTFSSHGFPPTYMTYFLKFYFSASLRASRALPSARSPC